MDKIKVIAIEDEPLARQRLAKLIGKHPLLHLVGVFENPIACLNIVKSGNLDLIISDVQMPGMDGVSFLRSLIDPPLVIFVTAYPEYAVEGFELEVLDYIVKPLTEMRFNRAIDKVRKAVEQASVNQTPIEHIRLKDRNKTILLSPAEIVYVQSNGDYVTVKGQHGSSIHSYTMKQMEKLLPSGKFVRIQRSFIVNIDRIKSVDATKVVLKESGEQLPIGIQFRESFFKWIGIEH